MPLENDEKADVFWLKFALSQVWMRRFSNGVSRNECAVAKMKMTIPTIVVGIVYQ